MDLTKAALPPGPADGFAAPFPGHARRGEPIAVLSYASAGDMKFGDARCLANRERFLLEAGIEASRVRGLTLAHSRRVRFSTGGARSDSAARPDGHGADDAAGADGLVFSASGDGIASADYPADGPAASVTVADCMPIWLLDRGSGAYGILHSGWRGTGILAEALREMAARFGTMSSSVSVILGPAIGECCYDVDAQRARLFAAEFGPAGVRMRGGSNYLDLRAANVSIAERSGVGFLLSIEACTSCDARLGSFRRQGAASFTRMLAVCGRSTRFGGAAVHQAAPSLAAGGGTWFPALSWLGGPA